jgi:hypothetical protein
MSDAARAVFEQARADAAALAGAILSKDQAAFDAFSGEIYEDAERRAVRATNLASFLATMADAAFSFDNSEGLLLPDEAKALAGLGTEGYARDLLARACIIDREVIAELPGGLCYSMLAALSFYALQGCRVLGHGDPRAGLRCFLMMDPEEDGRYQVMMLDEQ